ncbi:MAG TPA: hypothetical protein P5330_11425, partial [Candidatus Competibacteraceae bacterium]|nr:hypothetical protein [Candidatus Competibacteraceae bacterium]
SSPIAARATTDLFIDALFGPLGHFSGLILEGIGHAEGAGAGKDYAVITNRFPLPMPAAIIAIPAPFAAFFIKGR